MLRRWLPQPVLTIALTVLWMLLMNAFTPATFALGLVLGITIPWLTEAFWPDRPRLRRPMAILGYVAIVFYDIVVANVVVAKIVLFKPNRNLKPAFLPIPLDLRSPEAIATFANTITLTPGPLSADLSSDGRWLLVHALDCDDPAAAIADMKNRYEARLKEIFG